MSWTVGETAKLARVSVRTLHHYDEIGLLAPSGRSEAGYRLYSHWDLEQLQQILLFKELGFSLTDITRIMSDPAFDRAGALRAQRRLLAEKARRAADMLATVDLALEAAEKGNAMDEKDMFEVFGDFDPKQYEDEVQQRWGDTEAYKVSMKRTSSYTKEDWKRITAETAAINEDLAALLDEGAAADDARVMDVAERHRLHIDRYFYPCSQEMHVGLGEMYVADPRFAANYEKVRQGLAVFMRDAIKANAMRTS